MKNDIQNAEYYINELHKQQDVGTVEYANILSSFAKAGNSDMVLKYYNQMVEKNILLTTT
jgi:pentatricopeptide repeat protein